MDFKDIASSVSKYAPLLGSIITETNPLAGIVVMALSKVFNTEPVNLTQAIQTTTDAQAKLVQVESEHRENIIQYHVQDRISAREREVKMVQLTGKRDWVMDVLAGIVIIGFFCLCLIVLFFDMSDDKLVNLLIGQASSSFAFCLSYYFGASSQNRK